MNWKRPGVDRIESDRRIFEKLDELVTLVADHRLHFMAGGDVLDIPKAVAGPAGDRVDLDVEPAGGRAARVTQRQRGDAARRPRPGCAAARNRPRIRVGEPPAMRCQRRVATAGRDGEGGVGVGDAAVGGHDQLRVGRGFERLAQDVQPAGEGAMHPRPATAATPASGGKRENRDRGRFDLGAGDAPVK